MYSNNTFLRYSISVASESAPEPLNTGSVEARKNISSFSASQHHRMLHIHTTVQQPPWLSGPLTVLCVNDWVHVLTATLSYHLARGQRTSSNMLNKSSAIRAKSRCTLQCNLICKCKLCSSSLNVKLFSFHRPQNPERTARHSMTELMLRLSPRASVPILRPQL